VQSVYIPDFTNKWINSVKKAWHLCIGKRCKIRSRTGERTKTDERGTRQPTSVEAQAQDIKALGSEVTRLQTRLRHEQFRADAYPEMIQVAESKFKIAIRKKLGAKRS
jgi:hypothetical protein